ncbi:hypothetical protein [Mycoplasma zalophidermidis]|uniref:hypothetical protein n=1 Tax=Mycoplasma zalophidermidis TaxID=398174 RepID=UPI00215BA2F6|nr:hypothetical protein [Mycoplasma zalophidermidis]MCR8966503.1 hypothetical protein [Mycoplasma zalophidermidis]
MKIERKNAIYQLITILNEEHIKWSLSPAAYQASKQGTNPENFFSICVYWNDFLELSSRKPELFKFANYKSKNKSLLPYFEFENIKISIHIIIGTSSEKIIKKIDKRTYQRLLYWGDNTKSLLLRLKARKSLWISQLDLVNIFYHDRPTEWLITSSNIYKFCLFKDLNWNEMSYISVFDEKIPYFTSFNEKQIMSIW